MDSFFSSTLLPLVGRENKVNFREINGGINEVGNEIWGINFEHANSVRLTQLLS